jgi:3',5'-cyclic AMP phosphodiesterase CpdA
MFTGDLTHMTPDGQQRRTRMREFKDLVSKLKVDSVRFIPGEHDASADAGEAYRELFGDAHYSFDHKGIHFVALDNVSDPSGGLGEAQLEWLRQDLAHLRPGTGVVVFAHRPLFDLAPEWDWTTKDGDAAIKILSAVENVTVFYGHIHQAHHHTTGRIQHHAARSLIFPNPAPKSVPKRAPLPWDASSTDHGIGFREVREASEPTLKELAADGHIVG